MVRPESRDRTLCANNLNGPEINENTFRHQVLMLFYQALGAGWFLNLLLQSNYLRDKASGMPYALGLYLYLFVADVVLVVLAHVCGVRL